MKYLAILVVLACYVAGFLHGVETKTTQIEGLCADDQLLFDLYCCPAETGRSKS